MPWGTRETLPWHVRITFRKHLLCLRRIHKPVWVQTMYLPSHRLCDLCVAKYI